MRYVVVAMKARYTGETSFLELTRDKVYKVLSIEKGWYRIVDDSGEDYLYPSEEFKVVESDDGETPVIA